MNTSDKPDPSMYRKLREQVLQIRLPNLPDNSVHAVLMDWPLDKDMVTVLAAADGTASIYLSNGGGFIGGGQKYPTIRSEAIRAIQLANTLLSLFQCSDTFEVPADGSIFFYVTLNDGVRRSKRSGAAIESGSDPLSDLGNVMQSIISEYQRTRIP